MGNPKAFLNIPRKEAGYRPITDRVHDFSEVEQTLNSKDRMEQASRCMDCGVPFCHWACPLGNKCPEWNDALYHGNWERAYHLLTSTNPFPEFTGRICPALCEKSCVLYLTDHAPTTNRENEAAIMEHAWLEGFITPQPPKKRIGKRVAVVGSGPSGLSAAWFLNKAGVDVTVFEKDEFPGGLLRFGIPNFKLSKGVIDRRINLMKAEGIEFVCNAKIDTDALAADRAGSPLPEPLAGFDAYVIATGTPQARDLNIPGRELKGVHLALEILGQQNRVLEGIEFDKAQRITAKNKRVIVIGGGDTGSDCIGTAHRHGCKSVLQVEIMPQPPVGDNPNTPWPSWPVVFKTTSSHEEGCDRRWLINTNKFIGDEKGNLKAVEIEEIEWQPTEGGGRPTMVPTGRKEIYECEMALLALGFIKPTHPAYRPNVYLAGDAASGASLVVRAIASGRETAKKIIKEFKA